MKRAMTSERWQLIDQLFHASLERDASQRAYFLADSCGVDGELKQQIEALLVAYEAADDFIEDPPLAGAISSIANQTLKQTTQRTGSELSLIGRRIAHYEIRSLLGVGGMGEVYLAHDASLDRRIAIKILPPRFMKDHEHVARFEREARAASALNHPNIITIHEVGVHEETHFIATEFVSGQTLREKIAEGKLSVKEAVRITIQVAEALRAAHEAGLVHRDIKPENIMVRPDGLVKVLDFGLAKPSVAAATGSSDLLPFAATTQTDPAVLMGTLFYLSPEQVLRQEVDHRTDLFSLGVVLYEMVTGGRPFAGTTASATCEAIVNTTPDPINSRPDMPAPLQRIITRALEKNRAVRYQTAEQLKADLTRLERELDPGLWKLRAGFPRAAIYLIVFCVLFLAGLVYLVIHLGSKTTPPKTQVFEGRYIKQTAGPGLEVSPSLSPDGKRLVFASRATGNWDIYIQAVRDSDSSVFPNPVNLTPDSPFDDLQPAFSPDGQQIAFRSGREGGGIFAINTEGGAARKIADSGYTPVWSHDGAEIIFARANGQDVTSRTPPPSALHAVNVGTGEQRVIPAGDAVQPSCSPNGYRISYWGMRQGGQRDIWTVPTRGGNPVEVTNDAASDWNPVWSNDGRHIYFASDRDGKMNLWRVPIDEKSGVTMGKPEAVKLPGDYVQHFGFSKDGQLMTYVQESARKSIYQVAFDAHGRAVPIYQGSRLFTSPHISPDGQWLVLSNSGEKQEDLFVMRPDGRDLTQITNDTYRDRGARWSTDGRRIAFFSDRSGQYEIWVINSDGSGLEQLTYTPENRMIFNPIWSPDNQKILYRMRGGSSYVIALGNAGKSRVIEQLPAFDHPQLVFGPWDWSPDGSALAGVVGSGETGSRGIMLYSFETSQFEKVSEFGDAPLWLNDSRRLLFYYKGTIYLVDTRTKSEPRKVYSIAPNGMSGFTISRDNRSIYFSMDSSESDIWLRSVE